MGESLYLVHHGIKGQKWGVKNGPPYPLDDKSRSPAEKKKIRVVRKKDQFSRYNKKHTDQTIGEGTTLSTLSYNRNRTKDTDMFYAAYTKADIDHYKEFFDKKMPIPIFDSEGYEIGTGKFYKYSIQNKAVRDMKVASEDSGIKAFSELYKMDKDFREFVTDPKRLKARFEAGVHKFPIGYMSAMQVMDRMSNPRYKPSNKDLATVYRIFNHSIPSDGGGKAEFSNDVITQRAKFFNALKKAGYDAVLDTNDALYNPVQAQAPVIVFNMEAVVPDSVYRTTMADVYKSKAATAGRRLLGQM